MYSIWIDLYVCVYIYIYTRNFRDDIRCMEDQYCVSSILWDLSIYIYICLWLSKLQLQPVSFLKHGFLLLSMGRHHHNGRWEARIGRVFGNKYLYLGTYGIPPPSIIVIWNQLYLTWLDSMVKNIQILLWLIKTILYTIKWYTLVFFRSSKILKIETQFYNSGKG